MMYDPDCCESCVHIRTSSVYALDGIWPSEKSCALLKKKVLADDKKCDEWNGRSLKNLG